MFGYNYKMTVVNPDKDIVRLTPTWGSLIKAFAPILVLWAASAAAVAVMENDAIAKHAELDDQYSDE